jgi:hypothetical protein
MTAAGDTSPTEDRNIVKYPPGVFTGVARNQMQKRPAQGRAFGGAFEEWKERL